jgi:hypothetical protein
VGGDLITSRLIYAQWKQANGKADQLQAAGDDKMTVAMKEEAYRMFLSQSSYYKRYDDFADFRATYIICHCLIAFASSVIGGFICAWCVTRNRDKA